MADLPTARTFPGEMKQPCFLSSLHTFIAQEQAFEKQKSIHSFQ
ncbi:hypothetical protein NEOC65_000132 [Neochlamydia sp. AcF65]|nr:hypothetical protein [Neochlamydia sp. AcF65]